MCGLRNSVWLQRGLGVCGRERQVPSRAASGYQQHVRSLGWSRVVGLRP